ncbi:uncharacterized protein LOC144167501 [Haemaphysalis longicornis]
MSYIKPLLHGFGQKTTSASILQLPWFFTDIMKHLVGSLCLLFIGLTCEAYVVAETEEPSLDKILDAEFKRIEDEAILVGEILVEAARHLNEHAKLETESDEYFRDVWEVVKNVVKDLGKNFKESAIDTATKVKTTINAVTEEAKEKIKEKTLEILAKIFSDTLAGYAFGDFETPREVVNALCAQINTVGKDIIRKGKELGAR